MGTLLDRDEISQSATAVWEFLRHLGFRTDNRIVTKCKISVDHPHAFEWEIEVEQNGVAANNHAYILRSNAFKANGYYRPVWSSYNEFKWDDVEKELSVTLEDKLYKFTKKL